VRASSPAFRSLPPFRRGALAFALTVVIANMLLGDQPIAARLLLGPAFASEPWQPLSALLVFPPGGLEGVLATFLVQWILGSALERRFGPAKYLALALGAALGAYLLVALLGLAAPLLLEVPLGGTTPSDLAVVAAFGVVFARQPLNLLGIFPFTGRSLALLIAGVTLFAPPLRGAPWQAILPSALAGLIALLAVARPWRRRPRSGKLPGPRPKHLRVVH